MINEIQNRINNWSSSPFDESTIDEIKKLTAENNLDELTDRFYTNLEFGTGGLRGVIGAGTNRMNIYTVGMATQGLADYIISKKSESKGVVIAYDSRRMSDVFSKEAASILSANGIKVYLFDDIAPTPICSYAIRKLGAVSGIMITASHNPPKYNGYKVFWDDGGQIIKPVDSEIIAKVRNIESITEIKKADYETALKTGKIILVGKNITDSYFDELEKVTLEKNISSKIKIVYSPIHGTGYKIIPDMMKRFGFENLIMVKEQSQPDGNFPTVEYPNPEERETMKLPLSYAEKYNADIVLATDPDTDRMGVGCLDINGKYILLNGNQIGSMLEYYILSRRSELGLLNNKSSVIKTIVTTDMQEKIAAKFNCNCENVLTGFKWIAGKMLEYETTGNREFVFGGEESYGYLPVNFVRDKDAVSSCYFFCEMTEYLSRQNMTLMDYLDKIYIENGLYVEDMDYITIEGMSGLEKIGEIMKHYRNENPGTFLGKKITEMRDIKSLTIHKFNSDEITVQKIQNLPASDVIQFFLEDGTKITMRPSGTEPKIKFYFSVNDIVSKENIEEKKSILQKVIDNYKKVLKKEISQIITV